MKAPDKLKRFSFSLAGGDLGRLASLWHAQTIAVNYFGKTPVPEQCGIVIVALDIPGPRHSTAIATFRVRRL